MAWWKNPGTAGLEKLNILCMLFKFSEHFVDAEWILHGYQGACYKPEMLRGMPCFLGATESHACVGRPGEQGSFK